MELEDCRRLTGPSLLLDRPGATADVALPDAAKQAILDVWTLHVTALLTAIGWPDEQVKIRTYPGGASLCITAPIDALYAATTVIELAWDMTLAKPDNMDTRKFSKDVRALKTEIAKESNANLIALAGEAKKRGIGFMEDEDEVSIGLGKGRTLWETDKLPPVANINWRCVHNIPTALVTGTNGKSTTVRLAAAIGAAAGLVVASSSSDYVKVGETVLDTGDYSGPGGARMALRSPKADMAILETARGGLMRRGLPITEIEACLITNVSADHLGEYGITDVPALADAKFSVAKAVKPSGTLVLNHDAPELVKRGAGFMGNIAWYGLEFETGFLNAWIMGGGTAAYVKDGVMCLAKDGQITPVLPVMDFPLGLKGAAKYNISNALGAIVLTDALGIEVAAMTKALAEFRGTPEENPGRGNFMEIGGVNILVDFAHNPDGVTALASAVKDFPAKRRLFLLGQAGDRSDDDIFQITKAVCGASPDMIVVKELSEKLRGREAGEVTSLIFKTLDDLGVPKSQIMHSDSELGAVRGALAWAKPGDFLVLLVYVQRDDVLTLLQQLKTANWQAGDKVP